MAPNADQKKLLEQAFRSTLAQHPDLIVEPFPNLPKIPYPKKSKGERRNRKVKNRQTKRTWYSWIIGR